MGVSSLTHFNEEKISSRNKYVFNEPVSDRLNFFSSHSKCINPSPSVAVPYYNFKNTLRAPSPTIPGESFICSQKMDLNIDTCLPLNGNKHAPLIGIKEIFGFFPPPSTQLVPLSVPCTNYLYHWREGMALQLFL